MSATVPSVEPLSATTTIATPSAHMLSMQASKYSRFSPRGRFSHLEETLSDFNRWLALRYRAEAARRGLSYKRGDGAARESAIA